MLTKAITFFAMLGPLVAQTNVLTANYTNERSNSNIQETVLTTANVSSASFGRLGALPVDGQIYAQPLYVSGVVIPGQGTHNVIYAVTQRNSVFAYDADQMTPPLLLWSVNLGASVPSNTFSNGYTDIAPEVGILSTPVIDPARGVIYLVTTNLSGTTPAYSLHGLSLATGKETLNGPAVIKASVKGNGTGSKSGSLAFAPLSHIQRPGLLLANNLVWIGFGSHGDQEPWHGWLMTYNAADLSKTPTVITTTPNGWGGSIWQSGAGLTADASGNLYTISGNGTYDGVTEFAESFLKFSTSTFKLTDWFTPPNWQLMEAQDYDLSAGPALVPGTHTLIGGDKYGLLYVVNGDAMGHLDTGSSTAQVLQVVNYGEVFTFAVWGSAQAATIYLQEKAGHLKAFSFGPKGLATTAGSVSSTTSDEAFVGIAVSSNGTKAGTGIVWESTLREVTGNPGTLHAFDATNVATELWNSDKASGDTLGRFAKFATPTVANGKVYAPTGSNALVVYGIKPNNTVPLPTPVISGIGNSANYNSAKVSPGELVTIFGSNLGPTSPVGTEVDASKRAVNLLANTVVTFDGAPAPLIYASSTQVTAIVPFSLASTTTSVQVSHLGVPSAAVSLPVASTAPGIFSLDSSGTGQAVVINQDGTLNSAANAAPAGSVVYFYATGTGIIAPLPMDGAVVGTTLPISKAVVTAHVGGQAATVAYAGGAPGFVSGVMQINVKIPAVGASAKNAVTITVGGVTSQTGIFVATK